MGGGNEMVKKKKGSITVEAAMVLPFFVLAIYTLIMFMKIIYVHGMIQQALVESAEDIASFGYIYEQTGLLEIQQSMDGYAQAAQEENQAVAQGFEELVETMKTSSLLKPVTMDSISGGDPNAPLLIRLRQTIDNVRNFADEAISIYDQLNSFIQLLLEYNPIKNLSLQGYTIVRDEVGNVVSKQVFKKYLTNEELLLLGVVDGVKGLDFKQSKYYYSDGDDNDAILLSVNYTLSIPSIMNLLKEIKLVNTVKTRGWTGEGKDSNLPEEVPQPKEEQPSTSTSKTDSKSEPKENESSSKDSEPKKKVDSEEKKKEEDDEVVFVLSKAPSKVTIYHMSSCPKLHRGRVAVEHSELDDNDSVCERCKGNGGIPATVYMTEKTVGNDRRIFHIDEHCYLLVPTVRSTYKLKEVKDNEKFRECKCF